MSDNSKTFDVLVIGAGAVGLAAAYELAKAGVKVAVLERGRCGQEASWAGAGVLQCGSWHRKDPHAQMLRESLRDYADFVAELRELTGIDPAFVNCGSFDILLEQQQQQMAASEVVAAEAYHDFFGRSPLSLLTPEQARLSEPAITTNCLAIKHNAVSCQVLNPVLVQSLIQACLLRGVQIHENTPAGGLIREGDRVVGVRSLAGDFTAAHTILAAGAWSSQIDPQLEQLMPTIPVRGQIVLLQTQGRPFTHIIERGRCYMIPRLNGRIVLGATQEFDAGFTKANTAEGVAALLTMAQKLVPALASAEVVRTWSGFRPGSPDDWPYIGPVAAMPGLIAATAYYRSGLILTPISARIMADLILRGQTSYDLTRYAPGRQIKPRKRKQARLLPLSEEVESS